VKRKPTSTPRRSEAHPMRAILPMLASLLSSLLAAAAVCLAAGV
jgi:hypothetical protein